MGGGEPWCLWIKSLSLHQTSCTREIENEFSFLSFALSLLTNLLSRQPTDCILSCLYPQRLRACQGKKEVIQTTYKFIY